jgi:hypothetical protein
MPQSTQKFIITMDESTAKHLIAVGFKLISKNGGNYTFLNQPPKSFNFEQFDKTKMHYTNMLSI